MVLLYQLIKRTLNLLLSQHSEICLIQVLQLKCGFIPPLYQVLIMGFSVNIMPKLQINHYII
jgi:hypothetical protein